MGTKLKFGTKIKNWGKIENQDKLKIGEKIKNWEKIENWEKNLEIGTNSKIGTKLKKLTNGEGRKKQICRIAMRCSRLKKLISGYSKNPKMLKNLIKISFQTLVLQKL